MSKTKKQSPFYYEGEFPEAGAKIVIQFHPESDLTDIQVIKDYKLVHLWIDHADPKRSSLTLADSTTQETSFCDVVLKEIIDYEGEVIYLKKGGER